MKRILVYGMTSNNGGMESYIMNYFRKLNREELLFDFVTDFETIAWEDEIKNLGGKIFYVPSRRDGLCAHIRGIRKIIKDNKYTVVYYNLLSASAVFSVLAAKGIKGVKTVVHSHNDRVGNMKVHQLLRPILNKITNYRFACSVEAGKFMFGEKTVEKGLVKVINNAIDTDKFLFNSDYRNAIRSEFNIGNEFLVGHVGRMCYQKNSLFVIDIFNEILKRKPNSLLMYVGDGEDKQDVQKRVKDYSLENKVVFTGMRSDVDKIYSAMDVFLLPSRFEGFPVVAVEAQTSGLPLFASTEVDIKTKLTDNIYFISLDKSAGEWAEKVIELSDKTRKNNKSTIINCGYDINSQVKLIEDFFVNGVK